MASAIRIPVAKPLVGDGEIEAAVAVLRSGQLAESPGGQVEQFGQEFAEFVGSRFAFPVSNGTMALWAALVAAGVGYGDQVIIPDFTFAATVNVVLARQAHPVLVDIDPETFTISLDRLEEAFRKPNMHPKVVMPVHLYGYPAKIREIKALCESRGTVLVEDAAQAHGAKVGETSVGAFGIGCFSLYPTKNMTSTEGGVVTVSDSKLAEQVYLKIHHGTPHGKRYEHPTDGLNLRMTEVAAAIARVQLRRLPEWNQQRIRNADQLSYYLNGIPGIEFPHVELLYRPVYHQYTIRVKPEFPMSRDMLQVYLREQGIGSSVHYPSALHEQPAYCALTRIGGEESERAGREVLSLPVGPWLEPEDPWEIGKAIRQAAGIKAS